MADPFKRGPRRMFPEPPEPPAPVPIIELPADAMPPAQPGEWWRADAPTLDTARGDDLDTIGRWCGVSRDGMSDAWYREAIRAVVVPGLDIVPLSWPTLEHVELVSVRRPSAIDAELERLFHGPRFITHRAPPQPARPEPPPGSELIHTARNLDSRTGRLEIVRTYLAPDGNRYTITHWERG